MAATFLGQGVGLEVTVQGRGSLGIATGEDLAVDSSADLAIDELADLAVLQAVTWVGTDASEAVEFGGAAAGALAQSEA